MKILVMSQPFCRQYTVIYIFELIGRPLQRKYLISTQYDTLFYQLQWLFLVSSALNIWWYQNHKMPQHNQTLHCIYISHSVEDWCLISIESSCSGQLLVSLMGKFSLTKWSSVNTITMLTSNSATAHTTSPSVITRAISSSHVSHLNYNLQTVILLSTLYN